jgi:hypothetical protein
MGVFGHDDRTDCLCEDRECNVKSVKIYGTL